MRIFFFTLFALSFFAVFNSGFADTKEATDADRSGLNGQIDCSGKADDDLINCQRKKISEGHKMDLSPFHFAKAKNIFDFFPFIIRFATVLIGIVSVLSLIIGGFMYIVSFGDEGQSDKAKKVILGSLIGLAIVLASYVIQSGFLQVLYSLGK